MRFIIQQSGSGAHVEKILRALPEWFGIEKSTLQYIKDAGTMPSVLAKDGDDVVGFITIRKHFPETAEMHCLGVLPKYHRTGVGRQLVAALETHLKKEGIKFLQVKTISADSSDEAYAKTRKFYIGVGFTPLEVFPTLWDETNPCLLLVKSLV
ncbi:MAG: GNAT family N-acetyltransferase [Phycisphaerae bacterium]|jgi:ribosomal protein S18 acetylase RimI-like enzyme|nr:GNAT family N-acetyltransferase [Phycisphaerae bacterium]